MRIPQDILEKYRVSDMDALNFVQQFDEPPGSRVLVVGAHDEPTANMMAACGFDVTGVDLREYDKDLPPCNYKFVRGDFCATGYEGWVGCFDVAVALSCLEHFGLGTYSEGKPHPYYDVIAARKLWEMLREGGKAYITVPLGALFMAYGVHWRVYDLTALQERLVQDFEVVTMAGFVADRVFIAGAVKEPGDQLTPEEVWSHMGNPPHLSVILVLRKVPVVGRLAPDGR